jgi:hypothetical protein
MTKRASIESRELVVIPPTVQPPGVGGGGAGRSPAPDNDDGWQDWPADDSDQTPGLRNLRLSIVASFDVDGRRASTEEVVVNAAIDRNTTRDPAAMLQQFALTAAAAALIALATAVSAGAQEAPGSEPTPGHIIEAPVGHRQPHEWQLPRKVQRDEGKRTEQQIEFDKQLQICRGCE